MILTTIDNQLFLYLIICTNLLISWPYIHARAFNMKQSFFFQINKHIFYSAYLSYQLKSNLYQNICKNFFDFINEVINCFSKI